MKHLKFVQIFLHCVPKLNNNLYGIGHFITYLDVIDEKV
jgi:hypothetical protein